MTIEEARKAAEVMMAYADGKKIEYKVRGGGEWLPINELDTPLFDWNSTEYRIKKEPTYRPFKNKEECWAEMQKHQPFGWLKLDDMYINIVCVHSVDKKIELSPENLKFEDDTPFDIERMFMSFERTFNEYLFADGTPFGVKE